MAKVFEIDYRKGNYFDSVSKIDGTPTSTRFSQTGKGYTVYLDTSGSISYTLPSFDLVDIVTWAKGNGTLRVAIGSTNNDISLVADEWVFDKGSYSLTGETTIVITVTSGHAYIANISGYDISLTVEEENHLTNIFENSYPYREANRPWHTSLKPDDLSSDSSIVAAYNMKLTGNTLFDISGNGNNGTNNGAVATVNGLRFFGAQNIDIGSINLGNVFTIACQCLFNGFDVLVRATASDYIYYTANTNIRIRFGDFDNQWTNSPNILGKTVTLIFTKNGNEGNLYVNNFWLGTVSSGTGTDGFIRYLGSDLINLDGEINDFRVYNRVLSTDEIRSYYNNFANQVIISDRFNDEPVDSNSFLGWQVGSGSFKLGEEAITVSDFYTDVYNSGGSSTTDWIDTNLDGYADGWTYNYTLASITPSIVTGSGFTGNAQRFVSNTVATCGLRSSNFNLISGVSYSLRFKYRTDSATSYVWAFNATNLTIFLASSTLPANTGNAIEFTTAYENIATTDDYQIRVLTSTNGTYFEIDEISFIEQKYETISYPPELDLSAFKGAYGYIECSTAGTVSTQSLDAYGTWEFDFYKKDTSLVEIAFISTNKNHRSLAEGYFIQAASDESIRLYRNSFGTTFSKMITSSGYVGTETWYRLKIERLVNGTFYLYIKGGSFGENYVLVDLTGGSGTNPIVDDTLKYSKNFVLDLDAGDRFRALKKKGVNSPEQNNILSAYFGLTM